MQRKKKQLAGTERQKKRGSGTEKNLQKTKSVKVSILTTKMNEEMRKNIAKNKASRCQPTNQRPAVSLWPRHSR